ncbi:ergothioneine biosynthesis protein EgtB [Flavobacterium sp. CS20]|uniref:ergothioneine biosynthesis protein EgtB n=1 Tax=Flavobacterium sp. CS20 TaxID=2775246 RepID=UPI001B3A4C8A|nr:ergothioneine biosynthesis protein EgtB [Flavobacterium sp. CS20]QTY26106.1 ergothioneine biosynthesis protein EgtB [Flavobacterium sp. CS20]
MTIHQRLNFFIKTRQHTEKICKPLKTEDYVVQTVVDVSPPKWHLGHTTWFFEEFVLKTHLNNYQIFHHDFAFVFNSYYESVGDKVMRTNRGNLSRPSVDKIYDYRKYVNKHMQQLLDSPIDDELWKVIEIGIHHEKQHQELLLTDIKYILGHNPLFPVYDETFKELKIETQNQNWIDIKEGLYEIGHNSDSFCYDNELGRHQVYLEDFKISNRLVTNAEYLEFIEDGGYDQVLLWHAEAWDWLQQNDIASPKYWHFIDGQWMRYSLSGLQKLNLKEPLSHISYYEAFAFAQWKAMRLPTEFEWEVAQAHFDWGQAWEWTESAYLPYPKYQKAEGALGEYNGKFMVNQKVLRGKSIATPPQHSRSSYRNFFHPQLRWQFNAVRLVKS